MKHPLFWAICAVIALAACFGWIHPYVAVFFGLAVLFFGYGVPRLCSTSSSPSQQPPAPAPRAHEGEPTLSMILNNLSEPRPKTRIFADGYGRVKHMALMLSPYVTDLARTQLLGQYLTLFTRMEPDTRFTVVVQTDADQADVQKVITDNKVPNPERITFLNPKVGDLTVWMRDCMVCMFTEDGRPALLHQTTLHSWHGNDMQMVPILAASIPGMVLITEPFIVTDGGDVQALTDRAFVGYYSLASTAMKIADALAKDATLKAKVFAYYQKRYGKQIVEPAVLHFPYIKKPNGTPDGAYQLVRDPDFKRVDLGPGKADYEAALEELAQELFQEIFGKPIQVMGRDDPKDPGALKDDATDHMDMGATPVGQLASAIARLLGAQFVGNKTYLVGDPGLAHDILGTMDQAERAQVEHVLSIRAGHPVKLPVFQPRNRDDQSDFDAYVNILESLGYAVLRLPHLEPANAGDPYLSYNNCDMEQFSTRGSEEPEDFDVRRVFLPNYNIPKLDSAADAVWREKLGFEVIAMPLWGLSALWGATRCTTNWLDRSPRG